MRKLTIKETEIVNSLKEPFKEKMFVALEEVFSLEESGITKVVILSGYRSPSEQARLYQIGRSYIDGKWVKVGRTVTNANANQSKHNFGHALDVAIIDAKRGVYYDDNDFRWKKLLEIVSKYGLTTGLSFNDAGHIELPGKIGG